MKDHYLIVYYSHSGNTQKIAEAIQRETGGNIIRIVPRTPYPKGYSRVVAQAKKEIRSGHTPDLASHIPDIASYDTVFLGSPNWWSTIAPPFKTFLLQHDLSNKTVIPFCTHGGGGAGRVFSDIKDACQHAKVLKGFLSYGDAADDAQIAEWLSGIADD